VVHAHDPRRASAPWPEGPAVLQVRELFRTHVGDGQGKVGVAALAAGGGFE